MKITLPPTAALLALLPACSDGVGPVRPATLAPVAGDGASVAVASPLPVAIRVLDADGSPVGGVSVQWATASGGGTVSPATSRSAAGGDAATTWTLGGGAGPQTLTARVGDLPPLTITATAVPGAPHGIVLHGGLPTAAPVTTVLRPAVAVLDAHGNPVPAVTVVFAVDGGGGTLAPDAATTDAAGIAAVEGWTLGTAAGPNTATATVAGLAALTLAVNAVAGLPASMAVASGDGQIAEVATAVAVPPAVRVSDAHGNPVSGVGVHFDVVAGGGSVAGGSPVTDAAGVARTVAWTLGPAVGPNALAATVPGVEPVAFTAQATASTRNLRIESVHLNQGSQTLAGTIGAVAGRPGLLRVAVVADRINDLAPRVRIRMYDGAALVRDTMIDAPRSGVPTAVELGDRASTWNLALSAGEVVPRLSVVATIDAAGAPDADPSDDRFPRGGGTAPLDVRPLAPLRVVFIPVHASVQNTTGNISPANADAFLQQTRKWIPNGGILPTFRATYTTHLDLSVGDNWSRLLGELQAVRTAESAVDEYYHGIIGSFPGSPWGGYGYIPGQPSSPFRTAVTWDAAGSASRLVAHELGHNLGRRHAPCGTTSVIDPAYPHAGATLGAAGYDIEAGTVISDRGTHRDFMGYCNPQWTSDYTYDAILQWRRADPLARPEGGGSASLAPPAEGVLVWGRIASSGVVLEPVFTLSARPVLPEGSGPHRLTGFAADGSVLFSVSFAGVRTGHGADPDERHFTFLIPLGRSERERLDRVEVVSPKGSAERRVADTAVAAGAARPAVLVEARSAGRTRVSWDGGSYPMAMVRDARTGRVLALARGGAVEVRAPVGARIEVLLSDGVRSREGIR